MSYPDAWLHQKYFVWVFDFFPVYLTTFSPLKRNTCLFVNLCESNMNSTIGQVNLFQLSHSFKNLFLTLRILWLRFKFIWQSSPVILRDLKCPMSVNGLMANLGESHFQCLLYSVNQNVNLSFSEYVGWTCARLFIASVQKKCFYS